MRKGIELAPDNRRGHFWYGKIFRELGRTREARKHLELARDGGHERAEEELDELAVGWAGSHLEQQHDRLNQLYHRIWLARHRKRL